MPSNAKSIVQIADETIAEVLKRLVQQLELPEGQRTAIVPAYNHLFGVRVGLSMETTGLAILIARAWPPQRPAFPEDLDVIRQFAEAVKAPEDALVNGPVYRPNDTLIYAWYPKEPHRTKEATRTVRLQLDAIHKSFSAASNH